MQIISKILRNLHLFLFLIIIFKSYKIEISGIFVFLFDDTLNHLLFFTAVCDL